MIWSWSVVCFKKSFVWVFPAKHRSEMCPSDENAKSNNAKSKTPSLCSFPFLSLISHPSQYSVPMPDESDSCLFQGSTRPLYVVSISRIPRKLSFHWQYSIVHFPNLSQSAIQRKQGFLPLHIFIMTSMSSLSKTLHSPITTREHDDWDVEDVVVYWCWGCHFFGFLANSSICDTVRRLMSLVYE